MEEIRPLSIEDAFGELRDPRSRTPVHNLTSMLVIALCAILSGADSWAAIQMWGEEKLEGTSKRGGRANSDRRISGLAGAFASDNAGKGTEEM
ncbi:transposase family protein, partial [Burkholderia sp. DN3021]|uniref:transposase family protein n=1 Tax=Burkholderia sp. DN3021 TaxID=3410137 RepID=UPI003C7E96F4